jgi:hypothetical protein
MNQLYGGIDLHANNCVMVLVNEQDDIVYEKRIPNDFEKFLSNSALIMNTSRASSSNPPITGTGSSMASWPRATR